MESKLIVDITGLNRYHENLKNNVLTTKQDVISDLEDIRSGAAAGAGAAADATSKANAAQAAAIEAAAADATSKADAAQAAAEATAAADATSKANAAQAAAKTYADDLVKDAEGNVKFDAVGSATAALEDAKEYADGLATNYDAAGSATAALEDAKEYADGLATNYDAAGSAAAAQTAAEQKATDLNTAMDVRVAKLEAIDHEKLALDASATAVAAIVAGAESDFDTLKEVADWIASDKEGSAELQATVSGHTESINTINGDIDALEENKQDVISDLDTIRSGATAGATALQEDDLQFASDGDIDGLFA